MTAARSSGSGGGSPPSAGRRNTWPISHSPTPELRRAAFVASDFTRPGNSEVRRIDSSATSAASLRVEFFEADTSGEGRTFLFTACVAGNAFTGGSTFAAPGVVAGDPLVLTATSYSDAACTTIADGTSEFSNVVTAVACTRV